MTKEEFAQHVKSDTLPMYRLAYSILQNGADAEDAVSEAIVHAQGRLYVRMRMQEDGSYVRIYTAADAPVTLVSVDPESLQLIPMQGNANVIADIGNLYQWKLVAAGVDETADFILWGNNGVDIYSFGETAVTRGQESWEMPCGTEGTCAILVPDGRILYIGASGGFRGQTADGVEISGKDPAQTVFYYEPMKK